MRLLIIGDAKGPISEASSIARKNKADVAHVSKIEDAIAHICNGNGADLVMVDVKLDVGHLIKSLSSQHIFVDVIGCGFDNDAESAVNAIKAGAKEYIPLPPDEELIAAVLEAITKDSQEMIAESPQMKQINHLIDQVAPSDASILVTGESGTGKEVISKRIHAKSKRSNKRMISVNCAAIPDNLLESELFGHEKGAFTGALSRRVGKFEEANGSTILLDEISEMDLKLQAKLLRAIQEKEIDRVGGNKPIKVDIRIIATSNRNLQEEIKKGNFREDLYFRLNVINIDLPPLRARKSDIAAFANMFISKYCQANSIADKDLLPDALVKLTSYNWPGNVRELENIIHRTVLISSGKEITENDIILNIQSNNDNESENNESEKLVGRSVADVEKKLIIDTLEHCIGNRTQAANILGISIRTLRNKLNEYKKAG